MNSPKIVLSFNEVMFYFSRAAVGAGLPYGLAEDFGNTSIWIASLGLDPAEIVCNALQSLDNNESSISAIQNENANETILKSSEDKKLSALLVGPTVCDWILETNNKNNVLNSYTAKNIDSPFLVAAAVGTLNFGSWSISWRDNFGSNYFILIDQEKKIISSVDLLDISILNISTDVSIKPAGRNFIVERKKTLKNFYDTAEKNDILEKGVAIYNAWPIIYSLFHRCLVPSNENTRSKGAGAGLIEID